MPISKYLGLVNSIGSVLQQARSAVYQQINSTMVQTYWLIGKYIVEYEQQGKEKSEYGMKLLDTLSQDLKLRYGKGFGRTNLVYIRLLYLKYPIGGTLPHQLGWGHYYELLKIDNDLERSFYEKQCILDKRTTRELKRQKQSGLFLRLLASKDKKGVLELIQKGVMISEPKDIIKDPYVLEFLGMAEESSYSESELEQKIIQNLQKFLLELGKGFTFVGRQYRISLNNTHYYVDLVFYHRILKCFVLIDLKIDDVKHTDIGQMNMYLNYFKKEENVKGDNEPIGIVLARHKDTLLVEYALGGLSTNLFVSKYELYLPDKAELEKEIQKFLRDLE